MLCNVRAKLELLQTLRPSDPYLLASVISSRPASKTSLLGLRTSKSGVCKEGGTAPVWGAPAAEEGAPSLVVNRLKFEMTEEDEEDEQLTLMLEVSEWRRNATFTQSLTNHSSPLTNYH